MDLSEVKNYYSILMASKRPFEIAVIQTVILTVSFNGLVPQDKIIKKFALMAGIVATGCILAASPKENAHTCSLLFSFLLVQILMLGLSYLAHPKLKTFCIAAILVGVNLLGLREAVINGYHQQLFASPQSSVYMLFFVCGGFCAVWIIDRILERSLNFSIHSRRKIFHLVPLALLPGLHSRDYTFFTLMLAGSFYLFLQLEIVRFFILPSIMEEPRPLRWMRTLNQGREKYFWYTHLNLILGLGMTYYYFDNSLAHASLVLALADAMAALIGRKWGRHRIYGGKSLEGLLAFIVSTFVSIYACGLTSNLEFIMVASIVCGLIELFSGDVDNIALPMGFILVHRLMFEGDGRSLFTFF